MAGTHTQIEKLNSENYDFWKLQIEAILTKNDLWEYVNGEKPKPTADEAAIALWIKNDRKARADIILTLSSPELSHIKNANTAREVWMKLADVYESKGPAKTACLLETLLFTKMHEGEDMSEHLSKYFDIIDKLKGLSVNIDGSLLTVLLLHSIPNSYENFRCAIKARDELPTPQMLKIKLLEEANSRKANGQDYGTSQAYYTRNEKHSKVLRGKKENKEAYSKQEDERYQNPHTLNNKTYKHNYKCNYCNKKGHKASDCFRKAADRRQANGSTATNQAMLCTDQKVSESFSMNVNHAEEAIAATSNEEAFAKECWCIDSGATSHMCHEVSSFTNLKPATNQIVRLATNVTTLAKGIGTVPVVNQKFTLQLQDTLHVPELKTNLISVPKVVDSGRQVLFTKTQARVINPDGVTIAVANREGNLFVMRSMAHSTALASQDNDEILEWHRRLGHLNETDLRKLKEKDMVRGLTLSQKDRLPTCEICIENKQSATPFPKVSNRRSKELVHRIHSDLCGPMRVKSVGGAAYFATFIDDASRWVKVCILKSKDEVKNAFKAYKALVENQTTRKIKILRTDNGLEYCGKEFTKYLEECGIKREQTASYSPQQNGVAERMNRTLLEMARCMLADSQLPTKFWAEAVVTAAYIRNRCPSKSLDHATPFELWVGRKPSVRHLIPFGRVGYVLNKKPGKGKFEPRSEKCIFLGYSDDSKTYRMWSVKTEKVRKSRDVKFVVDNQLPESREKKKEFFDFNLQRSQDKAESIASEEEEDILETEENEEREILPRRGRGRPRIIRSGQRGRPKRAYIPAQQVTHDAQLCIQENSTPTVEEALTGPYASAWQKAMEAEYNALNENKAWKLVERPANQNVIGCRWVLRTKYNADGTVERRKARLVAKGYAQQPGVDFEETFAPVVRLSSIRAIVATAAQLNLKLYQLDIVMAYINGDLNEDVFMEQPEGFTKPGEKDLVCKLQRSLYGLKQSGRQWYEKLDAQLRKLKLKPCNADKCVYFRREKEDIVLVAIYVDDLIVATSSRRVFDEIKSALETKFKVKDLGTLHYCLGIEFTQDQESGKIKLSQQKYTEDVLTRFNMKDADPVSTPLETKQKLCKETEPKTKDEIAELQKLPYRSLVGALMYLAVATRPDIAHAVSVLSRFNENYGKPHWNAAKRVLRYLKGTVEYGLVFERDKQDLTGFVDSDWANDMDDRVSYTGYIFKLAGAAISWESRKQKTIALSSTEAEYMALTEAAKEATYWKNFFAELGLRKGSEGPITVYCDNQGAQKLMRNPVFHARTKHIDIKHHYVREAHQNGIIDVEYLPTNEMPADILTKSLSGPSHKKLTWLLGIEQRDNEQQSRD
ncbi:Retrovirus-related Pol polyprotein from transposon TNT 1-94 [Anthophora plagiata]